jgi:chromosomal replication initiation ATPase DnaA
MKQVICPTCEGKGYEMVWTAREAMVAKILFEAAHDHGVSVSDIKGRGRNVQIVKARWAATRKLREAGLMLKEISSATRRTHPAIIHALKKVV